MPVGEKKQYWSGLKGKPESASMKFLLKQGAHRFPGPGYNTYHDRILKEEAGHQRLIRSKINDMFASQEEMELDRLQKEELARSRGNNPNSASSSSSSSSRQPQQQEYQEGYQEEKEESSSSVPRFISRPPTSTTKRSNGTGGSMLEKTEPLIRGVDVPDTTYPRPSSAHQINTKPLIHLQGASQHGSTAAIYASSSRLSQQRQQQPISNSSGGKTYNSNNNNNNSSSLPSSSPRGAISSSYSDNNNSVSPRASSSSSSSLNKNIVQRGQYHATSGHVDPPALIESRKLKNLSELNAARLKQIWPQVARGWNSSGVQRTLATQGRDNEESPLRTVRDGYCAPTRPAATAQNKKELQHQQQQQQQVASGSGETEGAGAGGGVQQQSSSSSSSSRAYNAPPTPTTSSSVLSNKPAPNNSNNGISGAATVSEAYAYNRRVRAPAIPEPFLGKRGTSRQKEAESTSLLLRKLNDLEEEIHSQQRNRSEMSSHVQELRHILLHQGEEEAHGDNDGSAAASVTRSNDNYGFRMNQDTMNALSSQRRQHYTKGAHESKNVHFAAN